MLKGWSSSTNWATSFARTRTARETGQEGDDRMEYENVYHSDSGTKVAFKIKAECLTQKELAEALSFFAKSSHRFYLEAGKEIKRML